MVPAKTAEIKGVAQRQRFWNTGCMVLIVSALRNEGPYVLDWLAHYIGAGASGFVLYTNDCDDGTDELLDLLASAGVVEHHRHNPPPDESVQWHAFRAAWKTDTRKRAEWALVCDVDEYINIKAGGFEGLLNALPDDTDAVAIPWRLFGAGKWSQAPVTERNLWTMSHHNVYPIAATQFKTLFRVRGPFNQFGVHRPSEKKGAAPNWVCGSGKPLQLPAQRLSLQGLDAGRMLVEMNHYSLRSAEEFLIKCQRGLPHHRDRDIDLRYWVERNFQSVQDTSISLMAENTQPAKARLLDIPGVADIHARALEWHQMAFQNAMSDERGYRLYTQALLAGPSRELAPQKAAQLYQHFATL